MARIQFTVLLLLAIVVSCYALLERIEALSEPPEAELSIVDSLDGFGATPLDGRSLIDSWLGKRQGQCVLSSDSPCADGRGCCPTTGKCCRTGCARNFSDTCCRIGGTCPSGWGCCASSRNCYPIGGECCVGGRHCTPGNQCYRHRGRPVCCSNARCTGYVSGGVTLTVSGGYFSGTDLTTTYDNSPNTITEISIPTFTPAAYSYYTYSLTWYYVSWYWTWTEDVVAATTTETFSTSTTITTTTTVSIYASNTLAADRSFSVVSVSLAKETPSDATSLSSLDPTSSSSRAISIFTRPVPSIDDAFTNAGFTNAPLPTSTAVAATAGLRPTGNWGTTWAVASFMALWIGGGALMVWL